MKKEPLSDEPEARAVLDAKVGELRARGYERLRSMRKRGFVVCGPGELVEVRAESGTLYQLEAEVFWDDKKGGDLRVIVTLFEDCLASRTMSDDLSSRPTGPPSTSSPVVRLASEVPARRAYAEARLLHSPKATAGARP